MNTPPDIRIGTPFFSDSGRKRYRSMTGILVLLLFTLLLSACGEATETGEPNISNDLLLPDGFEATIVADSIGPARHLTFNDNGDIYVKLRRDHPKGSIVAMRDTDGDGRADIIEQFGVHDTEGSFETGIEIYDGYLYYSTNMKVFRVPLIDGELVPDTTRRDTIVIDDHEHGSHEHIAKPISFDDRGYLYVPYGAPSDVCQEENRVPGSMGLDPCPELEKHGGVWRFHADELNQVQEESRSGVEHYQRTGTLYATGIRSVVAMDWNPHDGELYVVQHGRDNLHRMWPQMYSPWDNAMLPAEEFQRVSEGTDFGWPYCYYNQMIDKRVLGPEYGGDTETAGRCADMDDPLIGFPGHFAPNDIQFYHADQFPEHYRHGAFIAWHGSTIRDPYPQAGYHVGFVPYQGGDLSPDWEVFANGFAEVDPIVSTGDARHRPMGLAVAPDGSLYISDSVRGRIWKITYTGDRDTFGEEDLYWVHREKEEASNIRTPDPEHDDLTADDPVEGQEVYNTYCAMCHQRDGEGAEGRFPPIVDSSWLASPQSLMTVTLHGLDTDNYEILMPEHHFLTDEQLMEIMNYIFESWGDPDHVMTLEEVRELREQIAGE